MTDLGAADAKKYWKLRNAGLCTDCHKPSGGKAYCPECQKMHVDYRRKLYHDRRDAGLCVVCGKPARPGMRMCMICAIRETNRQTEYYGKFRAMGLCPMCRKPVADGKAFCPECREKKRQYNRMRKERMRNAAEGNPVSGGQ